MRPKSKRLAFVPVSSCWSGTKQFNVASFVCRSISQNLLKRASSRNSNKSAQSGRSSKSNRSLRSQHRKVMMRCLWWAAGSVHCCSWQTLFPLTCFIFRNSYSCYEDAYRRNPTSPSPFFVAGQSERAGRASKEIQLSKVDARIKGVSRSCFRIDPSRGFTQVPLISRLQRLRNPVRRAVWRLLMPSPTLVHCKVSSARLRNRSLIVSLCKQVAFAFFWLARFLLTSGPSRAVFHFASSHVSKSISGVHLDVVVTVSPATAM